MTAEALGLPDRQMGKVAELSLGYGGANGAFHGMAKNYGLVMDDHDVTNLVRDWRDDNQWAVRFWAHLTDAAMAAVNTPLKSFRAGRVRYVFYPALMDGTLTCTLPCGTILSYPQCRVEVNDRGQHELTALKASKRPAYHDKEWARGKLWHGLLAENVTQATCASLLREKLAVCEVESVPVVGHVHDEIIVECSVPDSGRMSQKLQTIMEEVPSWASGLPLRAVPQVMSRYGK